jgi:hypothetical protein
MATTVAKASVMANKNAVGFVGQNVVADSNLFVNLVNAAKEVSAAIIRAASSGFVDKASAASLSTTCIIY